MDFMTCPFEVKADNSNDGRITGYGSTFGNVDKAGDTVAPGAFKKTIAECKSGNTNWSSMFSNHSSDMPIGVWTDISEDDRGLKLSGNSQAAKKWIIALLKERNTSIQFGVLVLNVLELFALRETNVKDVCVQLANDGLIENTWKPESKNKPYDGSPIMLSKARATA